MSKKSCTFARFFRRVEEFHEKKRTLGFFRRVEEFHEKKRTLGFFRLKHLDTRK